MTAPFALVSSGVEYRQLVASEPDSDGVPVLVVQRPDIATSVSVANELYAEIAAPPRAACGVCLREELEPEANWIVRGLADRWLDPAGVGVGDFADDGPSSLVIVGNYEDLRSSTVGSLLHAAHAHPELTLTFVAGRDTASTLWMAAKQWARPRPGVDAIGLFSSENDLPPVDGVAAFGPRDLQEIDVRTAVLDRQWRTIMFQGHGKDDVINLAWFTICGRNQTDSIREGQAWRPKCGYGLPCFKDERGLIDLRSVVATEIVLSACNAGPLPDLALYDPRYQLLLNAIDGPARRVSCALTVHNSELPENVAWANAARADLMSGRDGPSADVFSQTLAAQLPYFAFWHFGSAPSSPRRLGIGENGGTPAPDEAITGLAERAYALQALDLLPPEHRVRRALPKLTRKTSLYLMRSHRTADSLTGGALAKSIWQDAASIDGLIAEILAEAPEDQLASFGGYYAERGMLDPSSVREVPCSGCGRPAQRFTRRPPIRPFLSVDYVVCMRCGDVYLGTEGAPELSCFLTEDLTPGSKVDVVVRVTGNGPDGRARLGVFVPLWIRPFATISPRPLSRKVRVGAQAEATFTLSLADATPPQAYYVTAFAVLGLGTALARRHFGVRPLPRLPDEQREPPSS